MKVSVIIGSRNRIETLLKFLPWTLAQDYPDFEVLILDDASDQPYTSQISPTLLNHPYIKWFRSETPLGVGGGRNYLMHQASGDLLMSVDDDGHFSDLCTLTRVVNHAAHYPQAGNLVGRVINHTSSGNYTASPFSKYALRLNPTLLDHEQPVSTYLGSCCAIRRTAFQATGGYTMKTLYGAEEVELSYRLIQAHFSIIYLPDFIFHHYPASSALTKHRWIHDPELAANVVNRFFIAYSHLPWQYIPSYLGFWLSFCAVQAVCQQTPLSFLAGIKQGIAIIPSLQRKPLAPHAITYLKEHYGRLWY